MLRRHPRLGLLLAVVGLMLVMVGYSAGSSVAQTTTSTTAPVIGEEPTDPGTDAGTDTGTDDGTDTGTDDGTGTVVGEVDDELAATGSWDGLLTVNGLALIVIGSLLTMVGQPARPRGRHSSPNTKLRSSHLALVMSSITSSVGSARRGR